MTTEHPDTANPPPDAGKCVHVDTLESRLTPAQFARQEHVAKSIVTRWIESGRITLGPDGLIDATAAAERLATESPPPQAQSIPAKATAPPDTPATAAPLSDSAILGANLKYETYRLQKAKREQGEMEIDKSAGLLVERAEIDFVLADYGAAVRDQLESLADRLTPALATCLGDQAALHLTFTNAVRKSLEAIDQHLLRRLASLD